MQFPIGTSNVVSSNIITSLPLPFGSNNQNNVKEYLPKKCWEIFVLYEHEYFGLFDAK